MNNFLRNNGNNNSQRALKLSILNYVNANANQKNAARNQLLEHINRVIQNAPVRKIPEVQEAAQQTAQQVAQNNLKQLQTISSSTQTNNGRPPNGGQYISSSTQTNKTPNLISLMNKPVNMPPEAAVNLAEQAATTTAKNNLQALGVPAIREGNNGPWKRTLSNGRNVFTASNRNNNKNHYTRNNQGKYIKNGKNYTWNKDNSRFVESLN